MSGCKGLSVWTIRWILFFSEILEQTQLVERELVRTLQSLADVRLILLSEVWRTQGLSFTTYRPSFDQYTSRTTAYEKSYWYSSLLFVLRSFWSSKVLLINWACPNLYHFRGCIDLRPFCLVYILFSGRRPNQVYVFFKHGFFQQTDEVENYCRSPEGNSSGIYSYIQLLLPCSLQVVSLIINQNKH